MSGLLTAIPVYNGERFLPATLSALASQSRRPDRVVILDNASTDSTPEIVRSFRELPIEYRRNPTNIGGVGNLNLCLELSGESEYFHLQTADDIPQPSLLETALDALANQPAPAFAFSSIGFIDEYGAPIGGGNPTRPHPPRPVPASRFLRRHAAIQGVFLPAAVFKTGRRPIRPRFGQFPQVGDCVFFSECVKLGSTPIDLGRPLCLCRLSPINESTRHRLNLEAFVRDEWRAMRQIASWISEPAWRRPLTRALLTVILAARTEVKRQLFERDNPDYARQVDALRREEAGWLLGNAGVLAVRLRDLLRSLRRQPSRIDELNAGQGK